MTEVIQLNVVESFYPENEFPCNPVELFVDWDWPWFSVDVLLISPEMNEDSDCFLTVSFHILLIRLCEINKRPLNPITQT